MQITRPKIMYGYGDIQKIAQYLEDKDNTTRPTDATIRNALLFSNKSPLAERIRKIATEVFNLPVINETIEV